MTIRRWLWAVLIAASSTVPSFAQDVYPSRLVKIILPSAPGSTTDMLARLIADQLSQKWGKPVIVENISGGGMSIGATQVFRSPPDGYTLFICPPSPVTIMKLLYQRPAVRTDPVHADLAAGAGAQRAGGAQGLPRQ